MDKNSGYISNIKIFQKEPIPLLTWKNVLVPALKTFVDLHINRVIIEEKELYPKTTPKFTLVEYEPGFSIGLNDDSGSWGASGGFYLERRSFDKYISLDMDSTPITKFILSLYQLSSIIAPDFIQAEATGFYGSGKITEITTSDKRVFDMLKLLPKDIASDFVSRALTNDRDER